MINYINRKKNQCKKLFKDIFISLINRDEVSFIYILLKEIPLIKIRDINTI